MKSRIDPHAVIPVLPAKEPLLSEPPRPARGIHDHLGGTLTEMTLQLELALRNMAEPEKVSQYVRHSLLAARQAIQSLDGTEPQPSLPPPPPPSGLDKLTRREQEILTLLAKGFLYKEISQNLRISVTTVRTHLKHIYEKLGVQSRTEAAVKFLRDAR